MYWLLLILIFIRPFISSAAFPDANLIYSILFLFFVLIWFLRKRVDQNKINQIKYPIILFFLALFISLAFSQNKIISIIELYKYVSGILVLFVAISLKYEDKKRVILCLVGAGVLISFLAIYQYFFGFARISSYIAKYNITDEFILDYISRRRVFLPFITPNILGGYIAMITPLALIQKRKIWITTPLFIALL